MAVAKGQSEAGLSLGLRRRTLLRLIVLTTSNENYASTNGKSVFKFAKTLL